MQIARRRLEAEASEAARWGALYDYESELGQDRLLVGLDEVGRGPLAGPLAVGAVILPRAPRIPGLDDSKKLSEKRRATLADNIKEIAVAWTVEYIEAHEIDAAGMTLSLKMAFSRAVYTLEQKGFKPEVLLLDGNPLRFDKREINVVKGDAKCASIAAASILAKVERDALMCRYAEEYPHYDFDSCKGYGSPSHINAIKEYGLSPLHRRSFCTGFMQESLF